MKITFKQPSSIEDYKYVKLASIDSRFIKYIGKPDLDDLSVRIICLDGVYNGIVVPNVYKTVGRKHAEPLLFIDKRSIYSQKIIFKIINLLFKFEKVDSIIFKVYGNNRLMLNMMNFIGIPCLGKLVDVRQKERVDLTVFEMNKACYTQLYEKSCSYV